MDEVTILPRGKLYNYVPKEDITTLEVAWITYFFALLSWGALQRLESEQFEQWLLIERHFEEATND